MADGGRPRDRAVRTSQTVGSWTGWLLGQRCLQKHSEDAGPLPGGYNSITQTVCLPTIPPKHMGGMVGRCKDVSTYQQSGRLHWKKTLQRPSPWDMTGTEKRLWQGLWDQPRPEEEPLPFLPKLFFFTPDNCREVLQLNLLIPNWQLLYVIGCNISILNLYEPVGLLHKPTGAYQQINEKRSYLQILHQVWSKHWHIDSLIQGLYFFPQ